MKYPTGERHTRFFGADGAPAHFRWTLPDCRVAARSEKLDKEFTLRTLIHARNRVAQLRLSTSRFDDLLSSPGRDTAFETRSRRPPLNEVNAVLSFVYTPLANYDVRSSMQPGGPAAGIAHPFARGGHPCAGHHGGAACAPVRPAGHFHVQQGSVSRRRILRQTLKRYTSARKGRRKVLEQWRARKRGVHSAPVFEGESSHWDDPIRTVYAACSGAARGSGSIPAASVWRLRHMMLVVTYDVTHRILPGAIRN